MKEREKVFDVSTGKQKLLLDLPGISEVQSDLKKLERYFLRNNAYMGD